MEMSRQKKGRYLLSLQAQRSNPETARQNWIASSLTLLAMTKDHSAAWRGARASRINASSSTVWIGAKSRCAINSGLVGVRI
jgi:hypothetical protein